MMVEPQMKDYGRINAVHPVCSMTGSLIEMAHGPVTTAIWQIL